MTTEDLISLASRIVSSNVQGKALPIADLTTQLDAIYRQLVNLKEGRSADWKDTLKHDHIICLICGARLRSLGTHLQRQHNMTAREYRHTFGIPSSVSLAATDLIQKRSQTARERHQERFLEH